MAFARWWTGLVAGAALLALVACGGQQGGTSSPAGNPKVSVTTAGSVPWLAFQDGTKAWQALSGTSFTVHDKRGRYGVAWECALASGHPGINVVQATTGESTSVSASCQVPPAPATYKVQGTLNDIPNTWDGTVAVGTQIVDVTASVPTYTLPSVPAGVHPAIGYSHLVGKSFGTLAMQRNVTINSDTTLNFYLSGQGASYTLAAANLSTPPAGETGRVSATYVLSGGAPVRLAVAPGALSLDYPIVPNQFVKAGDAYVLMGSAGIGTPSAGAGQSVAVVTGAPGAQTALQLPPALDAGAGIGVTAGTATANWGASPFSSGGGTAAYSASYAPAGAGTPVWTVAVTRDWLGTDDSYPFPDFSGTAGWNPGWDLPTGVTATATVLALHANVGFRKLAAFLDTLDYSPLPAGTTLELTSRAATGTY